jgi:hypothetical protein
MFHVNLHVLFPLNKCIINVYVCWYTRFFSYCHCRWTSYRYCWVRCRWNKRVASTIKKWFKITFHLSTPYFCFSVFYCDFDCDAKPDYSQYTTTEWMQLAFYLWVFTLIGLSCGVKISTLERPTNAISIAKGGKKQLRDVKNAHSPLSFSFTHSSHRRFCCWWWWWKKPNWKLQSRNIKTAINHSCRASFKYKSISIFHLETSHTDHFKLRLLNDSISQKNQRDTKKVSSHTILIGLQEI